MTQSAENDAPPNYLLIHKTDKGIRIQPSTYYQNYDGAWCPRRDGPAVELKWPSKKWSRFVTYVIPPEVTQ